MVNVFEILTESQTVTILASGNFFRLVSEYFWHGPMIYHDYSLCVHFCVTCPDLESAISTIALHSVFSGKQCLEDTNYWSTN